MYIPIEERIKAITKGKCLYRHRPCDGLCNNCGALVTPESDTGKIVLSKQGHICTWEDLDTLENLAMDYL